MSARLRIHQIPDFLARYNRDHEGEDDDLVSRRERIRTEGWMRLADLRAVCDWKAPRAAGHARKNTDTEVQEITALAFAARSERIRVEVLQILHGVSYPTASVILHFYHTDTYPVLDFRALWSLRIRQPQQLNVPGTGWAAGACAVRASRSSWAYLLLVGASLRTMLIACQCRSST